MRLYLTSDTEWRDLAFVGELVTQVQPSILLLPHNQTGATREAARTAPDGVTVETLRRGQHAAGRCDAAVVLMSGGDPMRLQRDGLDAAVQLLRDRVLFVALRERAGTLHGRVDPVQRGKLAEDLRQVRASLVVLYGAVPDLQGPIVRAGTAVAAALQRAGWAEVASAWSAVENLRATQPRLAPWLIQPEQILGGWAAAIESA